MHVQFFLTSGMTMNSQEIRIIENQTIQAWDLVAFIRFPLAHAANMIFAIATANESHSSLNL